MLEKPVVFDWEKFRKLHNSRDDCLWKLALHQWLSGHDDLDLTGTEQMRFMDGFKTGWIACKAVEKSI